MTIHPPGPRHKLTETADGLTFAIPAKRHPLIFAFLSLWLCGWAAGEFTVPIVFFVAAKKEPGAVLFMLIWLSFWTLGGAFAGYIWLWMLRGVETIQVTPQFLTQTKRLFGIGRPKTYDASQIRALRLSPLTFNPFAFQSALAFWGIGGGPIAFDYGFKTYRFAAGLDEAEAHYILQKITARFPNLAQTAATSPPA